MGYGYKGILRTFGPQDDGSEGNDGSNKTGWVDVYVYEIMKRKFCAIVCVMLLGCTFVAQGQIETMEKVRFLALGDSYTIGQSVSVAERWPVQLIDSLRAKGIACYDPTIIATTGWRTDNLMDAIEGTSLRKDYNLVSLLIGVNNQYQGKTAESYSPEFYSLLEKAIELAGGNSSHVFVVSIPDYGYTPFGNGNQAYITAGINAFNAVNKSISDVKGVTYIDITPISRQGLEQPDLMATDGLHPSGKMYTEWVKLILDKLTVELLVTGTDQHERNAITVFPNPASSSITLKNLSAAAKYSITLRDTTGKPAMQKNIDSITSASEVDIQSLPRGVYFYELSRNGAMVKKGKFIKH